MSPLANRERRWNLILFAATGTALSVLVAIAFRQQLSEQPQLRKQQVAHFVLPTAVAPPDSGVRLPALVGNISVRPQQQFFQWATEYSKRLNIPRAALEAYAYAAALTAQENPSCRLAWTTLASIGQIESNHGRFAGAKLDSSARPTMAIRGIPLDGRPGVKAIKDTDGGQLDGDPHWDRAMGPLQFIPTTWSAWQVDADGDGRADPDDLDDAALAAARYLCASGGDLGHTDGWWRAVTTYNESQRYGQNVLNRADHYGKRSQQQPVDSSKNSNPAG